MIDLFALILTAQSVSEEPVIDGPPMEWLQQNTPFGMDITLDGKVWVNTNRTGAREDYAILGNDLYRSRMALNPYPRIWIRGYHLRNAKVAYRETKQLVNIDCKRDTVWVEKRLYYSAQRELLGSEGPYSAEPIVPGSIGESWKRAACSPEVK